jgi:predicted Zn-ribbon and HTH transcriptional regulator
VAVSRRERPPAERSITAREALLRHLREGPRTAPELSGLVGIPEKQVADHLAHVARSLRPTPERLRVEPAQCLNCGFVSLPHARAAESTMNAGTCCAIANSDSDWHHGETWRFEVLTPADRAGRGPVARRARFLKQRGRSQRWIAATLSVQVGSQTEEENGHARGQMLTTARGLKYPRLSRDNAFARSISRCRLFSGWPNEQVKRP